MVALQPLLDAARQDPVFAYSLLAALVLSVVSIGTALLRGDVAVLLRPRVLLRVMGAVLVGFALSSTAALPGATVLGVPWTQLAAGLDRFPLYLVALAYGPGVGLVAAALFVGLQSGPWPPGWIEAVRALELAVVGWLAIYPSPRSNRWAGPVDALLAYALAWGTGGIALLQERTGSVTISGLWSLDGHALAGVLASALLLALVAPAAYRQAFPHSRIAPPASPAATPEATSPTHPRSIAARDPLTLTFPELPRVLIHGRRRRELDPLPPFDHEPPE